jgi:hypothetical protein
MDAKRLDSSPQDHPRFAHHGNTLDVFLIPGVLTDEEHPTRARALGHHATAANLATPE